MKFWDINTEIAVRKKYDLPNLTTFCLNQSEYFASLLLIFFLDNNSLCASST